MEKIRHALQMWKCEVSEQDTDGSNQIGSSVELHKENILKERAARFQELTFLICIFYY